LLRAALAVTTVLAMAAVGIAIGVAQQLPRAVAASSGATGYATQNGGTTGGAGGQTVRATTGTEINQALCARTSSSTPIIIEVEGTIDHGNTAKVSGGSCDTADDQIELKKISNVTLIGVGDGAVFDQLGIHVREADNIIIQNVTVKNVKKSGSPTSNGGDAIGMESNVHNVWVDHVTLEASGCPRCTEDQGYDSLFDLKDNTRFVTLSYSILRDIDHAGLVGHTDSDTSSTYVTYHHDLYENIGSRAPLDRGATVHTYDNHFVNLGKSGVNSRVGAHIKVENNYFEDSKDVLGTFYTNELGYWQVAGNIYDNVTWSSDGDENHPAGPDPQSNTTVDIPYSYKLDPAACVPDIVGQTAGAGKGLRVSDGDCTPQSPPPTSPTPPSSGGDCPSTPSQPGGTNLSIGAGSDGSSKADGTGYGNVRDGDMSTYWSPDGSTGRISIKWGSATTVSTINIREAAGSEGHIGSWEVVDHDTGTVLTTGSGAGVITFTPTTLSKIDFVVSGSTGTPRVAEFETYADSTTQPPPTCGPTGPPPTDPPASGALYVAPGGSDGASGTESDPTTLSSAIGRVGSGGTIYMRGGTYHYSQPITIAAGNDGTSGGRTVLSAYPGETPMLDFSGESESSSNRGLQLFGSYWHLYGLVVENAGDNGIAIGGSDNTIERVETRFNADTGIQLSRTASDTPQSEWPSNNLVISCESHDNHDSSGENADGFAAKLTSGPGNVFQYDVAHNNSDDGWDLYTKTATGAIGPVTVEDSLSYDEGTLSDGTTTNDGDRNGFKLGGDDIAVDHVIKRNIAVHNGHHGFTYNDNPGSMTVSDNVSIDNADTNFHFPEGDSTFRNDTSCRFDGDGPNDKFVGDVDGSDQFWTGANGSRCSSYEGSLGWSFDSGGHLVVTFGGHQVTP
jgi:pectate lyase